MFNELSFTSCGMVLDGGLVSHSGNAGALFTTVGVAGWVSTSGPKVLNAWLVSYDPDTIFFDSTFIKVR
jgi:hypothetical protein